LTRDALVVAFDANERDRGFIAEAWGEAGIAALADRYDANPSDRSDLVGRVDVVPPSLAIAQAAEESGWGTSRFAVEANAVFGQWTFRKGAGVVPERRDPGKRHEVRSFEGLRQSVSAYMHNLNIHWAYKEFRRVRRELRNSSPVSYSHLTLPTKPLL